MFYCSVEVQCIINITWYIKDYLNNWIIVYLINPLAFILKACKYPKYVYGIFALFLRPET